MLQFRLYYVINEKKRVRKLKIEHQCDKYTIGTKLLFRQNEKKKEWIWRGSRRMHRQIKSLQCCADRETERERKNQPIEYKLQDKHNLKTHFELAIERMQRNWKKYGKA